jgi:hypothetical protein
LPFDTGVEISTLGDMIVEELKEGVAFFFFVADDIAGDCFFFAGLV